MLLKTNRSFIISKSKGTLTVFIIVLQACSYNYAMVPQEGIKLACEATGSAAALEGLKVISGAGSWINLIANVYKVGQDVKSHFRPNKEEQVHTREINKKLELIELRKNLRTCLIKNRTSIEKGALGIPSQCEDTAFLLSIMGCRDEVDRMAVVANKFNK